MPTSGQTPSTGRNCHERPRLLDSLYWMASIGRRKLATITNEAIYLCASSQISVLIAYCFSGGFDHRVSYHKRGKKALQDILKKILKPVWRFVRIEPSWRIQWTALNFGV